MPLHSKKALLRRFNVPGNNKTYWGLRVTCLMFLPDFHKIWNVSTDFLTSPQYQISRQSVQWDPRWYMGTHSGWMNMMKAVGPFRDKANVPNSSLRDWDIPILSVKISVILHLPEEPSALSWNAAGAGKYACHLNIFVQ